MRTKNPNKYDIKIIDDLMSSPMCMSVYEVARYFNVKESGFRNWLKRNWPVQDRKIKHKKGIG